MLYQISWEIYADKKNICNRAFSKMSPDDDAKDCGDKVKIVGRWHGLGGSKGVCICESDDEKAVAAWMQNWQDMCKIDVIPVIEDADVRSILKAKFAMNDGEEGDNKED